MVVVKLIGGLGNQLFQYAAGSALAIHHKTNLLLDTSQLNKNANGAYTQRNFELDKFNIDAQTATANDLKNFKTDQNKIIGRIKKLSPGLFNNLVFNEHQFNFHDTFFKLPKNSYLNGYWQSEKYFSATREKLLSEITLKTGFSNKANELQKKISDTNSVSLHIRRGDFVSLKSANSFHVSLELEYYKKALEYINNKINNPVFFVFSDDINWCKNNLDFLPIKEFVEDKEINTHEELILMSKCRHNIIANSSFSWWGAWLNKNADKIVIAPEKWFADKTINTNDLIPAAWIKL